MDVASKIALLTGFGGVLLGGLITFFTEWLFRRKDRKERVRNNFSLCLCESGRIYNELVTLYNALSVELPRTRPALISSHIRGMAAKNIPPSSLDTIILFSSSHKGDQIFSDLELLFRRFNSSIQSFEAINDFKNSMMSRHLGAGQMRPTGEGDIAEYIIDQNDRRSVVELVQIENLYRDFLRHIIEDIEFCISIINRLNINSERKFKNVFWESPPKLEIEKDFNHLAYLRDMPNFSASDLPTQPRH